MIHDQSEFERRILSMLSKTENHTESRLTTLETKLGGLEGQLSKIQRSLDDSNKNGSWRAQLPVLTVLAMVMGLVLLPIRENIEDLEADFADHENNHGHVVMIEEMAGIRSEVDNIKVLQKERVHWIESELLRLRDKVEEHQSDGHPHKVIGLVEAVGARVEKLESAAEQVGSTRWELKDGMESRERIAKLEALVGLRAVPVPSGG